MIAELHELESEVAVGLDVMGGIARLPQAMLAEAGFRLVHVSGLAVNRAREGTVGGESKCDPRDARVITDQVRVRRDLADDQTRREGKRHHQALITLARRRIGVQILCNFRLRNRSPGTLPPRVRPKIETR